MTMSAKITLPTDFTETINRKIQNAVHDAVATAVSDLQNSTTSSKPDYYNLGQAAFAASCSRSTLNRWLKKGLPVSVIDGSQRIKRIDLEAFIDSNTVRI